MTQSQVPPVMRISIPQDALVATIMENGRLAVDAEQVRRRLRRLLPERLRMLKTSHQRQTNASKALRRALQDREYHAKIEELLDTSYTARQARIQLETHRMLHAARASLRRLPPHLRDKT